MEFSEEQIRNNLKSLRVKKGFTQSDMAEIFGISRAQYSLYEKTPSNIKLGTLLKIIRTLGYKPDEFLNLLLEK
jgi:transcriptional regulator with XRE-family HTH domain